MGAEEMSEKLNGESVCVEERDERVGEQLGYLRW